jgi:phage-related protein (TIGR01555 family)
MKTVFYNTGIGDEYDSVQYLQVSRFLGVEIDKNYFAHIYANSWQARKVCEYYPQLMADTWGKVSMELLDNDLLFAIAPYLDKLKILYREAQILANIYGGATIIRLVDDGQDFDQPINYNKIKSIDYSRVFDRWEVFPLHILPYDDAYNPEYYQFFTQVIEGKLTQGFVHRSRVIRFRGKYIPPDLMRNNEYWEVSLLHDFLEPYSRYYMAYSRTLEAVRSAEIPVIGIENLAEEDENIKVEQKEIQQQWAQNRGVVIDKDLYDISIVSRQFRGIKDLLEIAQRELIASSDLTKVQMYKEFPSGLQATGKSELMAEALGLRNRQENQWGCLIREDLKLLMAMFQNQSNYEWIWNNAYFTTPEEEANRRLTVAQTDKIFHEMQALSSEEIRESHFGNNEYTNEITLKETAIKDEVERT